MQIILNTKVAPIGVKQSDFSIVKNPTNAHMGQANQAIGAAPAQSDGSYNWNPTSQAPAFDGEPIRSEIKFVKLNNRFKSETPFAKIILLLTLIFFGGAYYADQEGMIDTDEYFEKLVAFDDIHFNSLWRDFWNRILPNESEQENNQPTVEAIVNNLPINTANISPQKSQSKTDNPYWALPNNSTIAGSYQLNELSENERKKTVHILNQKFYYQKYQAVQALIKQNAKGSEVTLLQSLEHGGLWMRMNALQGLVRLRQPINKELPSKALGNSNDFQQANYFKRFYKDTSESIQVIMRESLKLCGSQTRLVILKNLALKNSASNLLFLVAAQSDQDLKIKKWLKFHMPEIESKEYLNLKKQVAELNQI